MNRHIYSITGLIIILTGVSVSSTKFKAAPANNGTVTVDNTAANPVKTQAQGTTQVAGIVSLAAGTNVGINGTPTVMVAGTPNINVANTPNVKVSNDAANPIPVAVVSGGGGGGNSPAARTWIAKSFSEDMNNSGFAQALIYTVPAGQTLEITDAYMYGSTPIGQAIVDGDIKIVGPTFMQFPISVVQQGRILRLTTSARFTGAALSRMKAMRSGSMATKPRLIPEATSLEGLRDICKMRTKADQWQIVFGLFLVACALWSQGGRASPNPSRSTDEDSHSAARRDVRARALRRGSANGSPSRSRTGKSWGEVSGDPEIFRVGKPFTTYHLLLTAHRHLIER